MYWREKRGQELAVEQQEVLSEGLENTQRCLLPFVAQLTFRPRGFTQISFSESRRNCTKVYTKIPHLVLITFGGLRGFT